MEEAGRDKGDEGVTPPLTGGSSILGGFLDPRRQSYILVSNLTLQDPSQCPSMPPRYLS